MIAPHQNSEVRLVLAGSKPLATIEKAKDAIGYSMAVSLSNVGMLVAHCAPTKDSPSGEIIITKPQNKGLIKAYTETLKYGVERLGIKGYHRQLGRLFGYSEADINEFIDAEIDCNCSKCNGA